MKTYMPLNGLRWSRNSGSANCDMPQSAVFGRPGGEFPTIWLLLQFKSRTTASHYQCSLSLPSGIVPLLPSQETWEHDHDVEHSTIR